MADFNYERAMQAVFESVDEADDAADGIARLIEVLSSRSTRGRGALG